MSELKQLVADGAAAVAGAIARREVSCVEVMEQCLGAIDKNEATVNAMMHVDADGARREAKKLDQQSTRYRGPLFGVPVVVKDNIDVAGLPATAGIRSYEKNVPSIDAPVITNLRKGDAIILGKTTLHEGALGATNDNPFSGRTHNPLRPGFTPGGSSGGSAAAVVAGYAPLAIGSDTLGSVRVPSAYCGIAGLKPTNGALSINGMTPLAEHLDTAGPMARCVDDLVLAMRSLCRNDEPSQHDTPTQNWIAPLRKDLRDVTIAVVTDFGQFEIDDGVASQYIHAISLATELGARLISFDFGAFDFGKIRRAGFIHAQLGAIKFHGARIASDPDGFSGVFHRAQEFVSAMDETKLADANATIATAVGLIDSAFAQADLIALPTTPQTAFSFDARVPDNQADLTALSNLHGSPALSLPAGVANGLPVGVQLMARRHEDARLLQMASALASSL